MNKDIEILERKQDKNHILNSYKKIARLYNFWSWLTESKAAKEVIKLADITDGQKILEIACGTGVVFEQIIQRNPNGVNVGIDLSPDMLNTARKRLKKSTGNYELKEGDALNPGFEDSTFDIVINNFMIDLMPMESFDKILRGFHRILKPGGILCVSTFSFGTKKVHKFWHWTAKHFPDLLTGCRPVSLKEYLIKAGFSIETDIGISQNTFPSEVIKARKN